MSEEARDPLQTLIMILFRKGITVNYALISNNTSRTLNLHFLVRKQNSFELTLTSRSMRLLHKKGVLGPGVLVSEASYRREFVMQRGRRGVFPEHYEPLLRDAHQHFANWVWDHSEVRIILLVGRPNIGRFEQRFKTRAVRF
jgi:hypothetical protein